MRQKKTFYRQTHLKASSVNLFYAFLVANINSEKDLFLREYHYQ